MLELVVNQSRLIYNRLTGAERTHSVDCEVGAGRKMTKMLSSVVEKKDVHGFESRPPYSTEDVVLVKLGPGEECVPSKRGEKTRTLLLLALCVAVVIGVVLAGVVFYLTRSYCMNTGILKREADTDRRARSADNPPLEPFTFEDIFDSGFNVLTPDVRWVKDGGNRYTRRESDLTLVDMDRDLTTLLVHDSVFNRTDTSSYEVSPDLQYVLLASDVQPVWRSSFTATYIIYVVGSSEEDPAFIEFPTGELAGSRLQFAGWSEAGQSLSFVYENNLYYQNSPTSTPHQVTSNGQDKVIFNGIADWNYEEDVLYASKAHYWSPGGSAICYANFNATDIPLIKLPHYGTGSNVYVEIDEIAYPKAGDIREGQLGPNSKAELYVVLTDGESETPVRVPPPPEFENIERYYTRVAWRDEDSLFVSWTNRAQNHLIVTLFDVTSQQLNKNYERQEQAGYISTPQPMPHFINGGISYVTVLPKPEEDGDWMQVALVTAPLNGEIGDVVFLTSGRSEVTHIASVNEDYDLIYYIATNGDPTERHLFRVTNGDSVCVTCGGRAECRHVAAEFSATSQIYSLKCQGPGVPIVSLRTAVGWGSAPFEQFIELNEELRGRLLERQLPTREFMKIPLGGAEEGTAAVLYPPGYTGETKHPLIVYTYPGPDAQAVTKRWNMGSLLELWLIHLSSSLGAVVAFVDGRGSGGQGQQHRYELYRNLGTIEVDDQITAGNFLRSLDAVDENLPSAIFGWSYGGFAVTRAMGHPDNEETFTCGLAVAPVASFLYYATAYTERYMGFATPDDNKEGYEMTDATRNVTSFHGKQYLLAHGTADDNVHYMNAALIINALIAEEVAFRQYSYPDEHHGIGSPPATRHLLQALTSFLENDCWPSWSGSTNQ